MEKLFKLACLFSFAILFFGACQPLPSAPTATISSVIANNVVTFSLSTANSSAYKWRFGDGDSAIVYSSAPLTHAYPNDGTTYTVTLLILGPGGENTATTTVEIPVMTQSDILTGGSSFTKGKAWQLSSAAIVSLATPDSLLTIVRNYRAKVLTSVGLSGAYTDQYIFFSDGNYTISPKGGGILAGLSFCTLNNIANVQPQAADTLGLTYAKPYIPPTGLTFALNTGKTLTIATTVDGISTTNVDYADVSTLSFSTGGFFGLRDFTSECILQQLSLTQMTVACFMSDLPIDVPQVGKINKVWILTFEVVK